MFFLKVVKWDFTRILFLSFFVVACHVDSQQCLVLVRADSLMSYLPDSALSLLENIDLNEIKTPADEAIYALLLTQARDKNYIVHTDDSLITVAVNYFDLIGDANLSGKSHYYLGRTYQDLKEYVTATREFLIAVALAEKVRDYHFVGLAQGNLGYIYYQQSLYDKADSLYCEAQKIAILNGDSCNLALILTARANICVAREDNSDAEALALLERASFIARFLHNKKIESVVVNALGALYESLDSVSCASDYISRGISLKGRAENLGGNYLLQGSVYYRMEKYDSAMVYLVKSLSSDSYYTKAGAYLRLSDISEKRGFFKEALRYKKYYLNYLDSAKKSEESAVHVLSLENKAQVHRSAEYYNVFLNKYRTYIYILLVLLLLGIALWVCRRQFYLKKAQDLICENQVLEESLNKMKLLQEDLQKKESHIMTLQEQLGNQVENRHELFLLKKQYTFLRNQKESLFVMLLSNTDSYKRLLVVINQRKQDPKCKLQFTDKDWEILMADINYFLNGFIERLKKQYELLNNMDIRFCCLIRIGLSYVDISLVFERSLDAMYKKRNRITEVKVQLKSKEQPLEDVLKTF